MPQRKVALARFRAFQAGGGLQLFDDDWRRSFPRRVDLARLGRIHGLRRAAGTGRHRPDETENETQDAPETLLPAGAVDCAVEIFGPLDRFPPAPWPATARPAGAGEHSLDNYLGPRRPRGAVPAGRLWLRSGLLAGRSGACGGSGGDGRRATVSDSELGDLADAGCAGCAFKWRRSRTAWPGPISTAWRRARMTAAGMSNCAWTAVSMSSSRARATGRARW